MIHISEYDSTTPQDFAIKDYDKLMEIDTTTKEFKHSVWKKPKE